MGLLGQGALAVRQAVGQSAASNHRFQLTGRGSATDAGRLRLTAVQTLFVAVRVGCVLAPKP